MNLHDLVLDQPARGFAEAFPGLLEFVWLELTGQCNLHCTHCYADSAPSGTHGRLTQPDWECIITEAKELGAHTVQFIGGEPTIHPSFTHLVRFAADVGLNIEVFTNLIRVPPLMWDLFEECSVSLATSFYSSSPLTHDRVTTRYGSQKRTLSNIENALSRSLPLRVGLVQVLPEQGITETEEMLRAMGVENIGVDQVRGIGRGGLHDTPARPVDALCGHCASWRAAVDPNGWVYPCVFSRWLQIGNVLSQSFSEIVAGNTMRRVRDELEAEFSARPAASCGPQACNPRCTPRGGCNPNCPPSCSPTCNPIKCNPRSCWPSFG